MSVTELARRLEEARTSGLAEIQRAHDLVALEQAQVRTLGRKALLARARSELGGVPPDERRDAGRLANEVQAQLEQALAAKRGEFEAVEASRRWEREWIDVTLPGDAPEVASLHPLTKTIWSVVDIFIGLGYKVAEGPEIELTRYIFDALNMPAAHPTRSPEQTFFVEGLAGQVCLRTETSPVQVRTMEAQSPPIYVVVPGRCYRRDTADATHVPGFVQIEGLAVDEGITMADLKGTLQHVARAIFGESLDVRLRPNFFPFTEPSAELDVQCFVCRGRGCRLCKQEGWIEVLGCGMVDPAVLEWVGYDAERYTGFAFGAGIERIAALAYRISDIRNLWDNDLRFLTQFKGSA
jgi:phenylalanyl-tRNA synthetase alpha chain